MGDQLQQVVSRPDQGAVVAHPSTLADIERKRNVFTEREAVGVAITPAHHVSKRVDTGEKVALNFQSHRGCLGSKIL
jgi:hypothetical protein